MATIEELQEYADQLEQELVMMEAHYEKRRAQKRAALVNARMRIAMYPYYETVVSVDDAVDKWNKAARDVGKALSNWLEEG